MDGSILEILLNLGVGGILLILLIRGDLVPRSVLNREIERGDKATEAASQNSTALTAVSVALKDVSKSTEDLKADQKSMQDKIDMMRGQR